MDEAQDPRVEGRSTQTVGELAQESRLTETSIQPVAEDGGPRALGEMNPNLVRAAGLQGAGDERGTFEPLEDAHMRDGAAAARDMGRETKAISRVPAVTGVEGRVFGSAQHDRHVLSLDFVGRKESLQPLAGERVLRHHHEAARTLVETMNDPGADGILGILGRRLRPEAEARSRDQAMDERACFVPPRRVDDQVRGLLDHEKVCVFEDDFEPDRCICRDIASARRSDLDREQHTLTRGLVS